MDKDRATRIYDYIKSIFPNPETELVYKNNFELLVAVILSAQATDKSVNLVTKKLFENYSDVEKLAKASIVDVENIIHSINYYRTKARNLVNSSIIICSDHKCDIPSTRKDLEELPGVGRKTANVILSTAFKIPSIAVDTHVLRVSNRLMFIDSKKEISIEEILMKSYNKNVWSEIHHLFVLFGRYKCKAKKPICEDCGLKDICIYYKKKEIKR